MSLSAHVVIAARGVDAHIAVAAGATLALLGPNGSGKSTVLEALGGLLRPDAGAARHGDVTLFGGGSYTEPRLRGVGFVAQDTSLFPSMTVLDNVAFGVRAGGAPRAQARATALEWLERVGAQDLAERRPRALSGGQARRVTIARALATRPGLMLLDEPFAGLDLESATAIRALVHDVLAGTTAVISTHDALDAHALADEVAVLDAGAVVEHGPTARVMAQPRTRFGARMAGRVLLVGTLGPAGLKLDTGGTIPVVAEDLAPGTRAAVAVHPRDIEPSETGLPDVVTALEPHGDMARVHGTVLSADVEPGVIVRLRPGDPISFVIRVKPTAYAV